MLPPLFTITPEMLRLIADDRSQAVVLGDVGFAIGGSYLKISDN